jgi:dTDP-4-dehydrorhamnose reductase
MRILLFGAAGQVGRELLDRLSALGEVMATVHRPSGDPRLAGAAVLDLADREALRRAVRDVAPRLIVNAAAYTDVDRAETEPELAMSINGLAPGVLAEEAARLGALLVHYSTDYVFDGSGERPWREDDAPGPLNEYGRTKLAGEEAIRAAGAQHLILRTSWLYSPWGRNFVATILQSARHQRELRVVADQVGAPTPARLAADATVSLLHHLVGQVEAPSNVQETLHVACSGETSWHGFAKEIVNSAAALDLPLAVELVVAVPGAQSDRPARRPINSRLDCRRLRRDYGICFPHWREAFHAELPRLVRALNSADTKAVPLGP